MHLQEHVQFEEIKKNTFLITIFKIKVFVEFKSDILMRRMYTYISNKTYGKRLSIFFDFESLLNDINENNLITLLKKDIADLDQDVIFEALFDTENYPENIDVLIQLAYLKVNTHQNPRPNLFFSNLLYTTQNPDKKLLLDYVLNEDRSWEAYKTYIKCINESFSSLTEEDVDSENSSEAGEWDMVTESHPYPTASEKLHYFGRKIFSLGKDLLDDQTELQQMKQQLAPHYLNEAPCFISSYEKEPSSYLLLFDDTISPGEKHLFENAINTIKNVKRGFVSNRKPLPRFIVPKKPIFHKEDKKIIEMIIQMKKKINSLKKNLKTQNLIFEY